MKSWILLLFSAPALFGQISLVGSGASGSYQLNLADSYSQNFDSLANSGTVHTFTNNSTLPGWYLNNSFYVVNPGSGGPASYGTGNSTDRALGAEGGGIWALRLVNNTEATITAFELSYTGEQWRRGSNNPQMVDSMSFSYHSFGAGLGGITGPGWLPVSSLGYTSPNYSDVTYATLDGNLPENKFSVSDLVSGLSLQPGKELWLR